MGKIGPFVGLDYEIGPFVGIGPVVGIGLFGGTGPVVSLTYIYRLFENSRILCFFGVKNMFFYPKKNFA